jgi:hypothetical protein
MPDFLPLLHSEGALAETDSPALSRRIRRAGYAGLVLSLGLEIAAALTGVDTGLSKDLAASGLSVMIATGFVEGASILAETLAENQSSGS